ncbi:Ribonucleases P/MRP protein subunit pop1 [Coemansia sp. Benny D115]|nr:Ribonucleases P/MRP protein subunit pop1 [Coemansia sp. Benny D115]
MNTGLKRKAEGEGGSAPRPEETLSKARALDVVGFVEARAFEINALQRSLDAARTSGNARAFQTLPRHLRRRAASHNVKRIPVRLRARALEEIRKSAGTANAPKSGSGTSKGSGSRHKRRRAKSIKAEYELRQNGKRWLETHVWHAKRMRMVQAWGTMVAKTPSERSHRAAYRAAKERCFVQDVSFMCTTELAGKEDEILRVLGTLVGPNQLHVAAKACLNGSRIVPLTLHRFGRYPLSALGPATALWMPQADPAEPRKLWLRLHPAIAAAVCKELEFAVTRLSLSSITVTDITTDVVSFELLGTSSTPLLAAILGHSASSSTGADVLRVIQGVDSPAALPEGAAIALRVADPRLSFPTKVDLDSQLSPPELDNILRAWPADAHILPNGDIGVFDRAQCAADVARRMSEHALNQRRSNSLVPGTKLEAGPGDVTVPLLLVRTGPEVSLGSTIGAYNAQFVDNLAHGWTLMAPRGWGMPLWMALVFAGARPQGLDERAHISLEAGVPAFPRDWPGTSAYDEHTVATATDAQEYWLRRPPAKRPNYASHGIECPFYAPFHLLLGMPGAPSTYPKLGAAGLECRMRRLRKIKVTKEKLPTDIGSGSGSDSADIWLVTGERLATIVNTMMCTPPTANTTLTEWAAQLLSAVRSTDSDIASDALLATRCLVRVRLVCTARGVPEANAPAKETLKLMLRQQIDSKRQSAANVIAKCQELEQIVAQLKQEAANMEAKLSLPPGTEDTLEAPACDQNSTDSPANNAQSPKTPATCATVMAPLSQQGGHIADSGMKAIVKAIQDLALS